MVGDGIVLAEVLAKRTKQSARAAPSPKPPREGSERIFCDLIGHRESEPVRVNETCCTESEPPQRRPWGGSVTNLDSFVVTRRRSFSERDLAD